MGPPHTSIRQNPKPKPIKKWLLRCYQWAPVLSVYSISPLSTHRESRGDIRSQSRGHPSPPAGVGSINASERSLNDSERVFLRWLMET